MIPQGTAGNASYTYLADGKVNQEDYGNGLQTKYEYDARGMIDSVRHWNPAANHDLAYRKYFRADNRDRISAWKRGYDPTYNLMEDGRGDRYGYDYEGQLTAASYRATNPEDNAGDPYRIDTFSYDELGNRKEWNDVASRGAMWMVRKDNGLNEYFSWQNNHPDPPLHWGGRTNYDDDIGTPWGTPSHANGVLMQDGYITAGFNALNQPIAIWAPPYGWGASAQWMWFGFDPLGRCVKRWMGSDTGGAVNTVQATYLYYDGWNLIQEGDGTANNVARVYVHGGRVDEIVASQGAGMWRYHHFDASGHCILLTGPTGTLLEQYEYDAFGFPYFHKADGSKQGPAAYGNRFLFTGREWLGDLRLYDYRNRMYQPELGRFLQPDPKEFGAGDYNLYRYCHNDPVNRSDPFGLLEYRFAHNYPDKGPGKREVVERSIEKALRKSAEGRRLLDAEGTVTIHPVDEKHPETKTYFSLNPKIKDFDVYLDPSNSRFQDKNMFRELSKHSGELPDDNDKGRAAIIGHEFAHGVFKLQDEIRTIREHENLIRRDPNIDIPPRRSWGGESFRP